MANASVGANRPCFRSQTPFAASQTITLTPLPYMVLQPIHAVSHSAPASTDIPPTADDLFALSLSLLTTLTAHSSPPPPTSYTSPPQSYLFDSLESNLGPTANQLISRLHRAATFLYGGSNRKAGARDWSLKSVVNGVMGKMAQLGGRASLSGKAGDEAGWRERVKVLGAGGVLSESEVREGMSEVLQLARRATEMGSAEALVLVGDLHLVRQRFGLLQHTTLKADQSFDSLCSPDILPFRPTQRWRCRRTRRPQNGPDRLKRSTSWASCTALILTTPSQAKKARGTREA